MQTSRPRRRSTVVGLSALALAAATILPTGVTAQDEVQRGGNEMMRVRRYQPGR